MHFAQHDHARGDAVHADLRCPGLGHGLAQHVQRGLAGAVVRMGGPRMHTAQRANVHNAAMRRLQVWVRSLSHQERPARVRGEHGVPLLRCD